MYVAVLVAKRSNWALLLKQEYFIFSHQESQHLIFISQMHQACPAVGVQWDLSSYSTLGGLTVTKHTHTRTPCEFVWRGLIPLNLRPEVGGLGGTAVLTDIQIPLFPLSLSHSSFSQAGTQTEGSLTQPLIPLKTTTATHTHQCTWSV